MIGSSTVVVSAAGNRPALIGGPLVASLLDDYPSPVYYVRVTTYYVRVHVIC